MQRHTYNINDVIQTGNPYFGPIRHISAQLGEIEWRFPFLAQALVFVTACLVLFILVILYSTVGLISQITSIFSYLIQQARHDMQGKPTIEQTGFLVAIGIYFLLWAPLWIVQLPLFIVGWLWQWLGYFSLVVLIVGGVLVWFYLSPTAEIPLLTEFSRRIHTFVESIRL